MWGREFMSVSIERIQEWDALLWSTSRRHQAPPDLLKALMRGLAERTRLQDASLWLREIGTLTLGHAGREIRVAWLNDTVQAGAPPHAGVSTLRASSVDHAVHAA